MSEQKTVRCKHWHNCCSTTCKGKSPISAWRVSKLPGCFGDDPQPISDPPASVLMICPLANSCPQKMRHGMKFICTEGEPHRQHPYCKSPARGDCPRCIPYEPPEPNLEPVMRRMREAIDELREQRDKAQTLAELRQDMFENTAADLERVKDERDELYTALVAAAQALEAAADYMPSASAYACVMAYVNGYEGSPDIREIIERLGPKG